MNDLLSDSADSGLLKQGDVLNNRYVITRLINRSLMSTVYLGIIRDNNKKVAIKVLNKNLALDQNSIDQFVREATSLRQLRHNNIVDFVDMFEEEQNHVIVTEYISGVNLLEQLKAENLSFAKIIKISQDICDALAYAHKRGIIHRDIKPENILISFDSDVKLADFGLAALITQSAGLNVPFGSSFYMAPECWTNQTVDAQSDLWSLGVVMYLMVCRKLPFSGATTSEVMNNILATPLPKVLQVRGDCPPELSAVIERLLSRPKSSRYGSARELAFALEQAEKQIAQTASISLPILDEGNPGDEFQLQKNQPESSQPGNQNATDLKSTPTDPIRATVEQPVINSDRETILPKDRATVLPESDRGNEVEEDDHAYRPRRSREEEQISWPSGSYADRYDQPVFDGEPRKKAKAGLVILLLLIIAVFLAIVYFGLSYFKVLPTRIAFDFTRIIVPTQTEIVAVPSATAAMVIEITPVVTNTTMPTVEPTSTATLIPTQAKVYASGAQETWSIDGSIGLYVPEGYFWMGAGDDDAKAKAIEKPRHKVFLSAFWIDQTEVTNRMYALCVDAGVCQLPQKTDSNAYKSYFGDKKYENFPVLNVTWMDANTYCEWAGRRLPTEAEWEKAARGTDGRIYPWGNPIPTLQYANYGGLKYATIAVGSTPKGASPYGAFDMAGNAWEWVNDYSGFKYTTEDLQNPPGPQTGESKVFRGGAWSSPYFDLRVTRRGGAIPSFANDHLGFRCASSTEPD